jgi:hypothetical protein
MPLFKNFLGYSDSSYICVYLLDIRVALNDVQLKTFRIVTRDVTVNKTRGKRGYRCQTGMTWPTVTLILEVCLGTVDVSRFGQWANTTRITNAKNK